MQGSTVLCRLFDVHLILIVGMWPLMTTAAVYFCVSILTYFVSPIECGIVCAGPGQECNKDQLNSN